jgi:hypothetical protein
MDARFCEIVLSSPPPQEGMKSPAWALLASPGVWAESCRPDLPLPETVLQGHDRLHLALHAQELGV